MNLTQYLILEIGPGCNLTRQHPLCPASRDRWGDMPRRPVPDCLLVDIAVAAYGAGFTGFVGWHYYCEPLLYAERIKRLMEVIRARAQTARFTLWTNGTLLADQRDVARAHDEVVVTDYHGRADEYRRLVPDARIMRAEFDGRLDPPACHDDRPCLRPFTEMVIDYYGGVHLCCYDWQGKALVGNVHDAPFSAILERWQAVRRQIAGRKMTDYAPEACKACGMRTVGITGFDQRAAEAARRWRAGL
jgi:MoaA/NifB/PqqE/SkfB family radical SAM enzyme